MSVKKGLTGNTKTEGPKEKMKLGSETDAQQGR